MPHDPLADLLALPDVAPAVEAARRAVDEAYRSPTLRRHGGAVAAATGLRTAVASAALAGSRYEIAQVRAGTVTDPVVQGALRCAEALPRLADRWSSVPRQVLAQLHVLAGRGVIDDDALGRPAPGAEVSARLDLLVALVSRRGPASPLVRAAVVHGELLALRAFVGPYAVVARAAARLELIAGGFDPRGLLPVDEVHLAREPEYVGAAGAFATGTGDGVRAWLRHCALVAEQSAAAVGAAATDA